MASPSDPEPALHPLLQRQLKRSGLAGEAIAEVPGLAALIRSVSRAYEDADQLRYLNDRAFAVSEQEQQALSAALRARVADAARDRARMIAVFDATPTPFLVLAAEGVILDANAAALQAFLQPDDPPTRLVGQRLAAALDVDPTDVGSRMKLSSLLGAVNERADWSEAIQIRIRDVSLSASARFRPFNAQVDAAGILSLDVRMSVAERDAADI